MSTDIETLASVCAEGGCKDSAAFEQLQTYILTRRYSRIEGVDIPTVAASFTAKGFTSPRKIEQVRQYLDLMIENSPDGYEYNSPSASESIYLDTVVDTWVRFGRWLYVMANTDCVVAQVESSDGEILKGVSVAAGATATLISSGTIKSIQLTSGTMTLYRDVDIWPGMSPFTWSCTPAGSEIQYTTEQTSYGKLVVGTIVPMQDPSTAAVTDLTISDIRMFCALSFKNTTFTTISLPNLDTIEAIDPGCNCGEHVINVSVNASLTTFSTPNLYTVRGNIHINNNPVLTSVSFPRLYELRLGSMVIYNNALLIEVLLPSFALQQITEIIIFDNASLTTIDLKSIPGLYWGLSVYNNVSLTSIDLTAFTRCNLAEETHITDNQIQITGNTSLTTITISDAFYPTNTNRIDVRGNALTATIVNRLVYYSNVALGYGGYLVPGGLNDFQLLMDDGTNSPPTGIYNTLVFVLRTYGATVTTN